MTTTAAVIGGGVVGACCALALQRSGFATTLIERGEPGRGASFGNAGQLGTYAVLPEAMPSAIRNLPRWLLDRGSPLAARPRALMRHWPWFLRFLLNARPARVEAAAEALAAMLARVPAAWDAVAAQAGAEALINRAGLLHVFADAAALRGAAPGYAMRARLGVVLHAVSAAEARAAEPALSGRVVGGVMFPEVATVRDPFALTRATVAAFEAAGGRVLRAEVQDLVVEDARVRALRTGRPSGNIEADCVVLAAGAWSGRLARRLGARVPLIAERGYHVMTRAGSNTPVRQPMMLADHRIAVTPMLGGLRMSTMVEFADVDAPPDHDRAARALGRAEGLLPGVSAGIVTRWMGSRPSTPDSLPVIGRAPGAANAILAFGHGHLGLTLAALTGEIVADIAAERGAAAAPGPLDLSVVSPTRFARL